MTEPADRAVLLLQRVSGLLLSTLGIRSEVGDKLRRSSKLPDSRHAAAAARARRQSVTAYYEDFAAPTFESCGDGGKAFSLYDQGTFSPNLA